MKECTFIRVDSTIFQFFQRSFRVWKKGPRQSLGIVAACWKRRRHTTQMLLPFPSPDPKLRSPPLQFPQFYLPCCHQIHSSLHCCFNVCDDRDVITRRREVFRRTRKVFVFKICSSLILLIIISVILVVVAILFSVLFCNKILCVLIVSGYLLSWKQSRFV